MHRLLMTILSCALLLLTLQIGLLKQVVAQTPQHPEIDARYYAEWTVAAPAGLRDRVVDLQVDFTNLLQTVGATGAFKPDSIHAYLVQNDSTLGAPVPAQFEKSTLYNETTNAEGSLLIYLSNLSETTQTTRTYRVYFDTQGTYAAQSATTPLKLEDNITYQAADSIRITTPSQIYIYDKKGAGMAALLDSEGNDWISHNTQSGGNGMYRGIPNAIEPEGGFHAGDTPMTSTILTRGPVKISIGATGYAGAWQGRYDIYPSYATFTITHAGHSYWLLYEGTPGGLLEPESDFVIRSNGIKTMASASWDGDIPAPEWAIFADGTLNRSLFMYLKDDDAVGDSYWPMGSQMTVFGIGRLSANLMTKVPNTLAFGLIETREHAAASTLLQSVFNAPTATLAGVHVRTTGTTPTNTPGPNPTCRKLQGDADCDDTVGLIDFATWKDEYSGQLGTDRDGDGALMDADFNEDSNVTLIDYEIWRGTYLAQ